jgi:antitoxin (DNA-binding transcriptional repressor) of toxin-antitoxin stability system
VSLVISSLDLVLTFDTNYFTDPPLAYLSRTQVGESFVILKSGKPIAQISPVQSHPKMTLTDAITIVQTKMSEELDSDFDNNWDNNRDQITTNFKT